MMLTTNIIQRVLHIGWNNLAGTAFTVDHGSKQYLVTARHVVPGIKSGDVIKIFHENSWRDLSIDVVGIGKDKVDVAVLACSVQLSPLHPLVPSIAGLLYGQSVSFLGYPFGWDGGGEHINRGVPLPFAKAGVVSALEFGDAKRIFLDAHGNKGFSGGPVVFVPHEQPNGELHVAGIVSHFPTSRHWQNWLPVVDRGGSPIINHQGEPLGYVRDNPGIVVAFSINHAMELIDTNPIGFQLPT